MTAPFWQTGPNGEVEPFLVTDWTVSEDSTTITCDLALDQGITWHDGEPLTMDDVLFTFDYNINVRNPVTAPMWTMLSRWTRTPSRWF